MDNSQDKIQIRVKCKNGQYLIDTLTGSDTVGILKSTLWSLTNIHPNRCRVMMGYPPQEIFLVDDDQLIKEIILNKRETLIIEELPDDYLTKNNERKMTRIDVPANNSCLFVSVFFCLTGHMQEKCPELRNLIAETVKKDPITYNEGFLGKPNDEYCAWIKNEDHWGGGIELSILSNFYEVEIVAVDTQNIRLNRFGEDKSFKHRIFLIFDGIHYDPLVIHTSDVNNPIQTSFSSDDLSTFDMALELARKAKENNQYTDLNKLSLKCNKCNKAFSNDEAKSHAAQTGHVNFSEYR